MQLVVFQGLGHLAFEAGFALGLEAAQFIHGVFDAAVDALFVESDVGDRVGGVEADAGGDLEVLLAAATGKFVAFDIGDGLEVLAALVVEMVEGDGLLRGSTTAGSVSILLSTEKTRRRRQ